MSDFDRRIDRRQTNSTKWSKYPPETLPFWVADMDFAAPDFVLQAIRDRVDHGIIGYSETPPSLEASFLRWLHHHCGWSVDPSWLVWLPGVVPGLNLGAMAASRGGAVLVPTPVYYPFLDVARHCSAAEIRSPLVAAGDRWEMDFDNLDASAAGADVLLLSNPQNPTGRAYTRAELDALVALCVRNDVVLVSDEIHASVLLEPGAEHVAAASLDPALKSISLYAPTKTYNIPGLACAVAVIPDADLRERFLEARKGLVGTPGALAYAACEAAFNDRSGWVDELNAYLRGNRDRLAEVVGQRMTTVEATYLGWINVDDLGVEDLETHFLAHGLGLSIGTQFAGPGYVRFNFACPRSLLDEGLERLASALRA